MNINFNFDLYRINIQDADDFFYEKTMPRARTDEHIVKILAESSQQKFDQPQETRSATYEWGIRAFYHTKTHQREIATILLARSTISKDGYIVTDEGLSPASSSAFPPPASGMLLIFDLQRHLVAVEHTGELSQTAWKDFAEKIIGNAALDLGFASSIELEPVPSEDEIINLFKSFDRIVRLKLTLRIPNPELTRYTRGLFEDLKNSNLREYTQDMKNPNGISKDENARPFASASLADQGYKKGEVLIEGNRDGTFEKVRSGNIAARGSISKLKDFIRGLNANTKTKEAQRIIAAITAEIDRIHPKDEIKNES